MSNTQTGTKTEITWPRPCNLCGDPCKSPEDRVKHMDDKHPAHIAKATKQDQVLIVIDNKPHLPSLTPEQLNAYRSQLVAEKNAWHLGRGGEIERELHEIKRLQFPKANLPAFGR